MSKLPNDLPRNVVTLAEKQGETNSRPASEKDDEFAPPLLDWPDPMAEAAMHGLAGDVVRTLLPYTEADPAALLGHFLAAVGNAADRSWRFVVEDTPHCGNLYLGMVGASSVGRKGTAWRRIQALFAHTHLEKTWLRYRVFPSGGLSTGEGLIARVADDRLSDEDQSNLCLYLANQPTTPPDWTPPRRWERDWDQARRCLDGRIFTVESEFGRLLRVLQRDGNTLSAVLRQAWDGPKLAVLTKESAVASQAHVSVVGHVTKGELLKLLSEADVIGGLANRFLWIATRRQQLLPDGATPPDTKLNPLVARLESVLRWLDDSNHPRSLTWDSAAHARWREVYPVLSHDPGGVLGTVMARSAPQVLRLSLIYAILDQSAVIQLPHLEAALEVLRYTRDSARWIWGQAVSPEAQKIMDALRERGPLTRTQINKEVLHGHLSGMALRGLLQELRDRGFLAVTRHATGGAPQEMYTLPPSGISGISEISPETQAIGHLQDAPDCGISAEKVRNKSPRSEEEEEEDPDPPPYSALFRTYLNPENQAGRLSSLISLISQREAERKGQWNAPMAEEGMHQMMQVIADLDPTNQRMEWAKIHRPDAVRTIQHSEARANQAGSDRDMAQYAEALREWIGGYLAIVDAYHGESSIPSRESVQEHV